MIIDKNTTKRLLRYEKGIRQEYLHIPYTTYSILRKEFVNKMLSRDSIYYTDYFKNKYESKARENLNKLLNIL